MAKAIDYKICCGLGDAYIARMSKTTPFCMTSDRREISKAEILTLIAWELKQWVSDNDNSDGFRFKDNDGKTIEVHYVEENN